MRDDDPERSLGARERNRLERHRLYIQAALRIVFADGLEALTMQRLAEDVGASVGSVYTYFPSKGALVAEVQREAIERLAASATAMSVDVEASVRSEPDAVAALAPVVAMGRFWLSAAETFPEEMQLLLLLLSTTSEGVPDAEAGRVVPAAMGLLSLADVAFGGAVEAGALHDGDAAARTIAMAASLTGCIQLGVVAKWHPDLLDPVAAGRRVIDALLLGWGADPDVLAGAHRVVDGVAAHTPLARPIPRGSR